MGGILITELESSLTAVNEATTQLQNVSLNANEKKVLQVYSSIRYKESRRDYCNIEIFTVVLFKDSAFSSCLYSLETIHHDSCLRLDSTHNSNRTLHISWTEKWLDKLAGNRIPNFCIYILPVIYKDSSN